MVEAYKSMQLIRYEKTERLKSPDAIFWARMKQLAVLQEPTTVSSLCFSPVTPHQLAATSGTKLTVFDSTICEPASIFSRSKQPITGASFRPDGSLVAIGGVEGKMRVFDLAASSSATPLRCWSRHDGAVHCTRWSSDGRRVIAFGENGIVRGFALSESAAVPVFEIPTEHGDLLRAGDASSTSPHLLVSGSLDHTARLWDSRTGTNTALLRVDHTSPIEQLLLFPNDCLLATAGGNRVRIWDLTAGGRMLIELANHTRTVTCLAKSSRFLLTGGLDRRLNVYSCNACFELVQCTTMPSAIRALAITPEQDAMAIGMANLIAVHRLQPEKQSKTNAGVNVVEQVEHRNRGQPQGEMKPVAAKRVERGVYAEEVVETETLKALHKLREAVNRELALQRQMQQTAGALQLIQTACARRSSQAMQNRCDVFGQVVITPLPFNVATEQ